MQHHRKRLKWYVQAHNVPQKCRQQGVLGVGELAT